MTREVILGSDLASIVEELYLGVSRTEVNRGYTTLVNPSSVSYVIGKSIIINSLNYPRQKIMTLLENGCNVVSRVWLEDDIMKSIRYCPYLIRANQRIMWSGETIDTLGEEDLEYADVYYSFDSQTLFFPKVMSPRSCVGPKGELNCIGYLLHQVGQNINEQTEIKDLDIVKTEKGVWT